MAAPKVEDSLSTRERELVAENRILKTRLARLERNPVLTQRQETKHSGTLSEENPYPVFRVDADGTLMYANPACETLLSDLGGQTGRRLPEQWLGLIRSALRSQTIERAEFQHRNRVFALRAVPVNNANYANVYGVDITTRKQVESQRELALEALRLSEEKYRAVAEDTPILICRFLPGGEITYVNDTYCRYFDKTPEELAGLPFLSLIPDADRETVRANIAALTVDSPTQSHEHRVIGPDDEIRWQRWTNRVLFDTHGKVFAYQSIGEDITEHKHLEETLAETAAILQAAMDCSTAGIAIADAPDGKLRYVNEAGLGIRGSEKKEIVDGIGIDHYVESWQILHFDGTPYADEEVPLARAIMHGETCDSQFIIRRPDNEDRIVWAHASPILDEHGKVIAGIVVFPDITEQKRAEQKVRENRAQLKSLASELVLAEERERSRLAVHLHDDVCQNLAYSKMKLQMVNASLGDQIPLDDVTEVTDTLSQMMTNIRSLTFELSSPVLAEFGLEAAISNWLEEQIEQRHGFHTVFSTDGQAKPLCEDVRAMLFRSVRELLNNAVKYSEAHTIEVSIVREEDQIVIVIDDNGIGFTPEDVVISTESGGFGLFSIRERLDQLGGSLEIHSSPGQGCKCILHAPLKQTK
jgi:PAS domain S-box-containing protein